ncbi:MAG: hypothetical protein ACD_30C00056G0022 [uncultured bacterium]|uniref:Ig-like domain-containing protein n=3 Tax=Candidatus Daviesiibacteriota TaxID=1752718 RepID=A0A0G0HDU1_9BACT|nr:MAG: hypothetical protein ACD_30C00056G0022 [uncultured bacterium]KKQ10274.1 MAG: hypothetical protein US19_C0007G0019 [Candidatus Daviesbacteria bacterium GW2011_GWB1_36_5]KKQ16375.1 MAG: hypothetical protein US28_C0002G0042 [Candidatus Daviesbacteria bacterium GW2011_GWA1_36_8]OGE32334.1 MAG: hypothetical protein A3C99_02325 [Candidatus Daviesbacteria bacterium RIFCSPHIGHO2_02_FULL_37_9]OGE35519.1 MAG: hypothetical protein A3E66_04790 [Candidatus Daviesbacteria bacterium RIFCSPHIGHO2_12_FU
MPKKYTFVLILSLSFYFYNLAATSILAADIPSFPSCVNPQGTVKANYTDGTHGIAGSNSTFQGSDAVYTLSENTLMQCFCAADGSGIQTNWWNVSSLSQNEIDLLVNSGWTYIPNGALWGLDNAPYLTQNSNFSCKSSSTTNSSSGGSTDQVAGISFDAGQVLGLASTGNLQSILSLFTLGVLSFVLGSKLSKPKKRNAKKSR